MPQQYIAGRYKFFQSIHSFFGSYHRLPRLLTPSHKTLMVAAPHVHARPLPRDVKLFAFADFQITRCGLYGSSTAAALLSDLQLLRLHSLFKCHRSGLSSMWLPAPAGSQLLRLYTQGIKAALLSSNLGVWARLVEARLPTLLYQAHPVLQLLRGISHQHFGCLCAPPPGVLIYAMIHVHMLCIYVGKTTLPLLQRLWKHGTTSSACAEDSSLQEMLRPTGLVEWTPVPLHFTTDEIGACFLERD